MESEEEFLMRSNWDKSIDDFDSMGLKECLLRGIYGHGFEKPSKIQQKSIKPITMGKDIIAQAPSGTGKTGAFVVGMLELVESSRPECQGLVLVPNFLLARQIFWVINQIGYYLQTKSHVCIDGAVSEQDIQILERGVQIVVGTPKKVSDMIRDKHLNTSRLKIFILDKADKLFSKYKEQIQDIFVCLPGNVQCCLFSTIISLDILKIAEEFMHNPARILINDKLSVDSIKQFYLPIENEDLKLMTIRNLYTILNIHHMIICANTCENVEELTQAMTKDNYKVSYMHEEMDYHECEIMKQKYRRGSNRVLITTDHFINGIDVQQTKFVINYDMPHSFENYFHRIGRSGLFGRKGVAISFITPNDSQFLSDLKQNYSMQIEEMPRDVRDYFSYNK